MYVSTGGIEVLSRVDPILGRFIAECGPVKRRLGGDPFNYIIFSILNQQISGVVASKIFGRMRETVGEITPEGICRAGVARLRSCGVSERKAACMSSIAGAVLDSKVDFDDLKARSDAEVEKILCAYPGIGRWTVEMVLIFCFNRPDVFSVLDFGVRMGFRALHPRADIKRYKRLYSPYGTTATLYMWERAAAAKKALEH